jgi:hypothetical protein
MGICPALVMAGRLPCDRLRGQRIYHNFSRLELDWINQSSLLGTRMHLALQVGIQGISYEARLTAAPVPVLPLSSSPPPGALEEKITSSDWIHSS